VDCSYRAGYTNITDDVRLAQIQCGTMSALSVVHGHILPCSSAVVAEAKSRVPAAWAGCMDEGQQVLSVVRYENNAGLAAILRRVQSTDYVSSFCCVFPTFTVRCLDEAAQKFMRPGIQSGS
jgi:hypothetical protein